MNKTSTHRRWKQYAAAAAGVVGTAVGVDSPDAHATILYGDPPDLSIGLDGPFIYFDLDQSGGPLIAATNYALVSGTDFGIASTTLYDSYLTHFYGSLGDTSVTTGDLPGLATGQLAMLSPATLIGPASSWDATQYWNYFDWFDDPAYPWDAGGTGYIGLRLGTGPTARYGWAQITYDGVDTLTLHDFAIELNPDTAIQAGTTGLPEPSTLALLGPLGAAGLLEYRRRKRRAQAAAESSPTT